MIDHLDHIVLTTAREAECIRFYCDVLGMRFETFIGGTPPVERKSFKFGPNKINLHVQGREFEPKAHLPVPGALDLCFIASVPLDEVVARLRAADVAIVDGRCCARARRRGSARFTCATPTSIWSRSRSPSPASANGRAAVPSRALQPASSSCERWRPAGSRCSGRTA